MKCNACWREVEGRGIATTCGHVYCTDDASRILVSDSSCPMCDQILSKSQMKAVDLSPGDEWINMAMAGVPPQSIMKCAFKGIAFWIGQKDLEVQLTARKAMQLRQRQDQMQAKFMEKLEQVHNVYQKAMKRIQSLGNEIESLTKDKTELQEKYTEKSRQKRKLEEMYDALRNDYEQLKRMAIQPVQKDHILVQPRSNQDLFRTPTSFDAPLPRLNQDECVLSDPAPVTPAQAQDFWPVRNRNKNVSVFHDMSGLPQPKSTGPSISLENRQAPSPFKGTKSGVFTQTGNNPSSALRNLFLSPMKRPPSRLRAGGFTS